MSHNSRQVANKYGTLMINALVPRNNLSSESGVWSLWNGGGTAAMLLRAEQ